MQLYLDCDGVLADFDKGATAILGLPPRAFEKRHGLGKFWQKLASAPDFYFGLPLMDDAMELFEGVRHVNPIHGPRMAGKGPLSARRVSDPALGFSVGRQRIRGVNEMSYRGRHGAAYGHNTSSARSAFVTRSRESRRIRIHQAGQVKATNYRSSPSSA